MPRIIWLGLRSTYWCRDRSISAIWAISTRLKGNSITLMRFCSSIASYSRLQVVPDQWSRFPRSCRVARPAHLSSSSCDRFACARSISFIASRDGRAYLDACLDTIWRTTASCWKSFSPNRATSGVTAENSLQHTMATPPKWCGRNSPSSGSAAP